MRTILIVITSLFIFPVFGQNHFIGLKGGINWTNINSTMFLVNNNSRTGFNGGFTYQYFLNERFNIGGDLLYFQRGFTNDAMFTDEFGNPSGEKLTIKFDYDYLSVPLKGGMVLGDKFSGFANLGIVPAILIKASTKTPAIEGVQEESVVNFTDKVNRFDLAGLTEIGANYKLNTNLILSVSLEYQYSFTSLTNDNYFSNSKIHHYGMVMSFGLKYALNKK